MLLRMTKLGKPIINRATKQPMLVIPVDMRISQIKKELIPEIFKEWKRLRK